MQVISMTVCLNVTVEQFEAKTTKRIGSLQRLKPFSIKMLFLFLFLF